MPANNIYYFTYHGAILIFCFFSLIEAYRSEKKLIDFSFFLTTLIFFAIIGSRMVSFSFDQWETFLYEQKLNEIPGRSALGALIGICLGIFFYARCMGLPNRWYKHISYALPLAFAIQKFGCLAMGCCYGVETNLPWSVCYHSSSVAFQELKAQGHILNGITHTANLHPVQLYESILWILVFIGFTIFRHRISNGKKHFIILLISGLCIRFISEFFRYADIHSYMQDSFYVLKKTQWVIASLIAFATMMAFFIKNERKDSNTKSNATQLNISILIFVLILFLQYLFEPVELYLLIILNLIYIFYFIYKSSARLRFSIVPIVIFLGVISTSQQVPFFPFRPQSDSLKPKLNYITASYDFQNANISYSDNVNGNINYCGSTHMVDFHNIYQINGVDLAYHMCDDKYKNSIELGLYKLRFVSNSNDTAYFGQVDQNYLKSVYQFDSRRFGFRLGFYFPIQTNISGKKFYDNLAEVTAIPDFRIRYGNPYYFYFSLNNLRQITDYATKESQLNFEIGSQFQSDNILMSVGINNHSIYCSPLIKLINKKLDVTPFLVIPLTNGSYSHFEKFGINIRYRIM